MNRCSRHMTKAASVSVRYAVSRSISSISASQAFARLPTRPQQQKPTLALARSLQLASIRWLSLSPTARAAAAAPPPPADTNSDDPSATAGVDPNTTPHVHTLFTTLTHAINSSTAAPDGLRRLAYALRTSADAALFQSALKRWRTAKTHQDRTDNILFFDRLFAVHAHDVLLDMLCDRPAYRLLPDPVHIDMLLMGFRSRFGKREAAQDEARAIETLDQIFKTFAVALYTDIPPTADMYAQVILACLESGTKEGVRRAQITAKEQASLGLPIAEEVKQKLAAVEA
ncbi:hypothetical protein HDU86_002495 [Geranomyces michiganensis]|nr:hypothetical protein HDU86_002495 [Geranomyces michiganensis]